MDYTFVLQNSREYGQKLVENLWLNEKQKDQRILQCNDNYSKTVI